MSAEQSQLFVETELKTFLTENPELLPSKCCCLLGQQYCSYERLSFLFFEKAFELDPKCIEACSELSNIYFQVWKQVISLDVVKMERTEQALMKAIQLMEILSEYEEQHKMANYHLGVIYMDELKEYDKALFYYSRFVKQANFQKPAEIEEQKLRCILVESLIRLGFLYFKKNRVDESLTSLSFAEDVLSALTVTNPFVISSLKFMLWPKAFLTAKQFGQFEKSLQLFQTCYEHLQRSQTNVPVRFMKWIQANEFFCHYRQVLELAYADPIVSKQPQFFNSCNDVGLYYDTEMKDNETALHVYSLGNHYTRMSRCYINLKRFDEAKQCLFQALENSDGYMQMAWYYTRGECFPKDVEIAFDYLIKGYQKFPQSAITFLHYIDEFLTESKNDVNEKLSQRIFEFLESEWKVADQMVPQPPEKYGLLSYITGVCYLQGVGVEYCPVLALERLLIAREHDRFEAEPLLSTLQPELKKYHLFKIQELLDKHSEHLSNGEYVDACASLKFLFCTL
jgi:tetratricopeptide (TPR) repeat protein